jgi:hypothetical protein
MPSTSTSIPTIPPVPEWLKNLTPEDFSDVPDPRDNPPQAVYKVGSKLHFRVQTGDQDTDSDLVSLDLEITHHVRVAANHSQIVVAAVKCHDGPAASELRSAKSVVIKFFDPVYLYEELLAGTKCEWADKVGYAAGSCDAEFEAYQVLSDIQGTSIPICYGKTIHTILSEERTRRNAHRVHAILLQHLDIKPYAAAVDLSLREKTLFIDGAEEILHAIHKRGVFHQDAAPRNFCLDATGRMFLLDFENADIIRADEQLARYYAAGEMSNFKRELQACEFIPKNP